MSKDYAAERGELLRELDGLRVEIDIKKKIGFLILSRPPLNIVSYKGRSQIRALIEALDEDVDVGVIVIRGDGGIYTSGGDVKSFPDIPFDGMSDLAWNIGAPERCSKPVIAALEKYAFGVGFELCLACDFRLCSKTALFALPEQRLAQIPGSGGSIRLLHMIGIQRTKDMTFRSRRVTGNEAKDWGMVLDCLDDNQLESAVDELVDELRTFSPLSQRTIKRVLNTAQNTTLEAGIEIEGNAYGRLRSSDDFREGVESFHAKRKPDFKGS